MKQVINFTDYPITRKEARVRDIPLVTDSRSHTLRLRHVLEPAHSPYVVEDYTGTDKEHFTNFNDALNYLAALDNTN